VTHEWESRYLFKKSAIRKRACPRTYAKHLVCYLYCLKINSIAPRSTNKNLWILMRQRLWGLGVAMTSARPCASHSRQMTTPTPNHQIFTGRVLFRTPKPTVSKHWRHKIWLCYFTWWKIRLHCRLCCLCIQSYYTPWVKKKRHLTLAHNFTKYWPIFKTISLLDSGNL